MTDLQDTPRKHITVRVMERVSLNHDPEEGVFGTVITFAPESAQVIVLDATKISDQEYWATIAMTTDQPATAEDIEALLAEQAEPDPPEIELPPATQIAEAREKRTARRQAKKEDPPPTA